MTAKELARMFISGVLCNRLGQPANIVDGLHELATAINNLAAVYERAQKAEAAEEPGWVEGMNDDDE